jgi:hypothetical protein
MAQHSEIGNIQSIFDASTGSRMIKIIAVRTKEIAETQRAPCSVARRA